MLPTILGLLAWEDALQFHHKCKERRADSPIDGWMTEVRAHRLPEEPRLNLMQFGPM